jgi:hypothetical protein
LIINKHFGSCESTSTAVSSVKDSDSIDPVLSVELNFPPLADTLICVGKFGTVAKSIGSWIGVVAIVSGLSHTSHVEANLGVSSNIVSCR